MSTAHEAPEDRNEPELYEIRIRGHLDDRWADWFEGLTITREAGGETRLSGPVADQAALHGLLRKVRDLGLPLLSVAQIGPEKSNEADVDTDTGRKHSNRETNR
jgi:hypothetical protein